MSRIHWWRRFACLGAAIPALIGSACTRASRDANRAEHLGNDRAENLGSGRAENLGSGRAEDPGEDRAARVRSEWPTDLAKLAERARARFAVPTLTLARAEDLPPDATLLDVRTAGEMRVSQLKGATALCDEPARQAFLENARRDPPEAPVIVYCTAGWRSAEYTRALNDAGIPALNLEGGICAFAVSGGALIDATGSATRRIHAFSDQFASCVPPTYEAVITDPRENR